MKVQGKVFVVTGGASGIGRELVRSLMARGARVAAVDLHPDGLEALRAELGEARLSIHVADVSDREVVAALPDAVVALHGTVDAIINNAGVIQPFIPFVDLSYEVIERMINVNLWSQIHMIKAFMPLLQKRPEAHIVNLSSMGGFLPFPGQTMYSASKAAVKLLSEGLYAETIGTPIHVSVVMPGAVNTNISQNSGVAPLGGASTSAAAQQALPAPIAARIILEGVEANRLHILVGKDSRMLNLMVRIAPTWAIGFIQRKMAGLFK